MTKPDKSTHIKIVDLLQALQESVPTVAVKRDRRRREARRRLQEYFSHDLYPEGWPIDEDPQHG